jgi:hypothetical protein
MRPRKVRREEGGGEEKKKFKPRRTRRKRITRLGMPEAAFDLRASAYKLFTSYKSRKTT